MTCPSFFLTGSSRRRTCTTGAPSSGQIRSGSPHRARYDGSAYCSYSRVCRSLFLTGSRRCLTPTTGLSSLKEQIRSWSPSPRILCMVQPILTFLVCDSSFHREPPLRDSYHWSTVAKRADSILIHSSEYYEYENGNDLLLV